MKVLVTGHKGYIGSILTPVLLEAGHEVAGMDSDLYRACGYVGDPPTVPETIKDIRDCTLVDFIGFDAVIHLAGLSNDPLGNYQPGLTYEINASAAIRVAECAREAGVRRLLFASSCSNYGKSGEELLDENATFKPVTPYGTSKVKAEQGINSLATKSFTPIHLRAGTAFGLSPRIRFDLVLNNLVAWAVATKLIRLKSDGSAWRPLVHVADVVQAYRVLLEADTKKLSHGAYNIGSTQQNFRICDLADLIMSLYPEAEVKFASGAFKDERNYRVDCSRLEKLGVGYQVRMSVADGIREMLQALQNHPVSVEEFEGHRFGRVAHVLHLIEHGLLRQDLRWN